MSFRIVSLASLVTLAAIAGLGSPAQAQLTNGGFEAFSSASTTYYFVHDFDYPGWHTTATDHYIEVWKSGFLGVPAYEGNQFVELNAFQVSTLYQDVSGIAAGNTVGFHFAHRGREGVDTMQVDITDAGADGVFGTVDDTTLFSKQYSDDNTAWGYYNSVGLPPITTLGHTLRFSYDSISAAGGNAAIGNFLDDANFGIGGAGPSVTPEGGSMNLLLVGLGAPGLGMLVRRRLARKAA